MDYIVSVVVMDYFGKFLLLKRSPTRMEFPNKWNFVCGKIEDESPLECALREMPEELGKAAKFMFAKEGEVYIDSKPEGEWCVHPMLFRYEGGEIFLDGEHVAKEWVAKERIQEYDIVPGILENLKRLGV